MKKLTEIKKPKIIKPTKIFKDYISGDKFFSDEFVHRFILDGACIEAFAKYVTKGTKTVTDIEDRFALEEIKDFSKIELIYDWVREYV